MERSEFLRHLLDILWFWKIAPPSTIVSVLEPHFSVFPDFKGASYARRYELLCERLVRERLYNAAALLLTPQGLRRTFGRI